MAELLVGLFLLACAVLGLVSAHLYLRRSQTMTDARAQATQLAENTMADIVADSFSQNHLQSRTPVTEFPGFAYAVDERLEQAGLKRVAVAIYFPESGQERQLSLTTFVYDLR
ncbi:hypothetical protein ABS71_12800 [bacterium SCN 62-11]|nr:MAG: hypothetical protein ABS71_12800 [bacterium SCN 62-11]